MIITSTPSVPFTWGRERECEKNVIPDLIGNLKNVK